MGNSLMVMFSFRLLQAHHNHTPTHNMVTLTKTKEQFLEHHNQRLDMQGMPDIQLTELSQGGLNKEKTYYIEI